MNENIKKLLAEIEAQEKYCTELENETIQHRGMIDADLLERYLKSKLSAVKHYALVLDRNLQGEPSYG